jgi:hypothetical protein
MFGNVHVSSSAVLCPFLDPFFALEENKKVYVRDKDGRKLCPESGRPNSLPYTRKENPSSDAPPHSFPPVHLSESNDSKVPNELGSEGLKGPHASESKDTVTDSAGLNSEHLPPSESKSDSETELPFKFPATEGASTEVNSNSPLYSPGGRMHSSSFEEESSEVKQESSEGQSSLIKLCP